MSFAALVVVGDEAGHVGFGTGKAKEVPNAIKKAVEAAKNNLDPRSAYRRDVAARDDRRIRCRTRAAEAGRGRTGVIAGGAVRAVLQSLGVHNVRTKILGSNNAHNVIRATFNGLTANEGSDRSCTASRQAGRRISLGFSSESQSAKAEC